MRLRQVNHRQTVISVMRGLRLLRIDLKSLGKNRKSALEYLQSWLDEPLKVKGDQVELSSTTAKEAKTLLHKFLHHAHLENYHVSVINSRRIEIHPVEAPKKSRARGKGGSPPMPWETVGSLWYTRPPGFERSKR